MKKINTDNSTFEEIIRNGELYVDKTMYILPLICNADHMFSLARPDGFGKSLFSSTLHALFEGKKELFKGLYIEDKYSFEKFPVLHFNFVNITAGISFDEFLASFSEAVYDAGKGIGIEVEFRKNPAALLLKILRESMAKYGKGVALMIDEFDSPLTTAIIEGKSYIRDMRSVLNDFYSVIKNSGEYIRFFLLSGVTQYIFSGLNNLVGISQDPKFEAAFGYTDEEIEKYFGEALDENWKKECSSREEFVLKLKENYGGYCFSSDTDTRVYNPRSVGKFFTSGCDFNSCWMNEDSLSLIINTGMKDKLLSLKDERNYVNGYDLAQFDISYFQTKECHPDVTALLYFSGYLTVKESSGSFSRGYYLEIPNREAMRSLEKVIGSIR